MKKQYIILSLVTTFFLSFVTASYSAIQIINVENNQFNPTIFNVNVGDTIMWSWIEGFHTTTSTNIPIGAVTWDSQIDQTHLVFYYVVNVSGVYDYQCSYHGSMGMLGHFVAYTTAGINENVKPAPLISNAVFSDELKITFNSNPSSYNIEIMNITGSVVKKLRTDIKSVPYTEQIPIGDLSSGIYILNISDKESVTSTRIVKY